MLSHTPSLCLLFWKILQIFDKSMLCSKLQVAGQAGWVGLHLWNSWQRCVGRRDKHFFLSFQSFNLSTLLPHFIAPCLYFTRKVIPFFRPNFRNSWRQRCVGRGEGDKLRTTLTTDRPPVHPPYLRAQNESVSKIPTKNTFWRQNEFLPIFGQKVADKHDRRQSLPMLVWSQRLDQITRL